MALNTHPLSSAEVKERVARYLYSCLDFMACSMANFAFTFTCSPEKVNIFPIRCVVLCVVTIQTFLVSITGSVTVIHFPPCAVQTTGARVKYPSQRNAALY